MSTRDGEDRDRRAVYLPDECWDWLEKTAEHDGVSRSDLLEGLVLLAMDEEKDRDAGTGVLLRSDDRVAGASARAGEAVGG